MKISLNIFRSAVLCMFACLPAWGMTEELDITIAVINEGEKPAEFINRIELPSLSSLQANEDVTPIDQTADPVSEINALTDEINQELKSVVSDTQKTHIGLGELQSLPKEIIEKIPAKIVEDVIDALPENIDEVVPVLPEPVTNIVKSMHEPISETVSEKLINELETEVNQPTDIDVEIPDTQGIVEDLKENSENYQEAIKEAAKNATEINQTINEDIKNSVEDLQKQQEINDVTDGIVPVL